MSTTIRINKDVKELLKLKSVETGISQIDLANKYILNGIKNDKTPKKAVKSIEEIEKLLIDEKANENVFEINFEDDGEEILEGISLAKEGEENKAIDTDQEIEKILENDKPEGDIALNQIAGVIETEETTDAVKLKKESLKPRSNI